MAKIHKHLMIDAEITHPPTDTALTEAWVRDIIKAIDMEVFIPPVAKYCDDPCNEGLSVFAMITTSHFTAHFWNNNGKPFVKADLYSCKGYDPQTVISFFNVFEPVSLEYSVIDRTQFPHKIETQGQIVYNDQTILES